MFEKIHFVITVNVKTKSLEVKKEQNKILLNNSAECEN